MKIFLLSPLEYDYEEYKAWVVVASDKERALKLAKENYLFNEYQYKNIYIEEISLNEESSILGSYNGFQ